MNLFTIINTFGSETCILKHNNSKEQKNENCLFITVLRNRVRIKTNDSIITVLNHVQVAFYIFETMCTRRYTSLLLL